MDMERVADGIVGTLAIAFGIHAIVTKRVTLDDVDDDGPVWFYGWRAVAIGCLLMAISAFCFAAALGFVHLDGL